MTKEELEKEAKEYVTRTNNNDYTIEAYIAGAEPREKRIDELEKENAELKERLLKIENAYKRKSEAEWRLNDLYQKVLTDFANAEKCSREYFSRYRGVIDRLIKAKEIIGELIKFQPYIDREAMFHSIGNEWKIAIYKARQFLKEVEK